MCQELNHGTNCFLHELKDQDEIYLQLQQSIDDLEEALNKRKAKSRFRLNLGNSLEKRTKSKPQHQHKRRKLTRQIILKPQPINQTTNVLFDYERLHETSEQVS